MVWLTKVFLSGCTSYWIWKVKWLFLGPPFPLGIPVIPKQFLFQTATKSLHFSKVFIVEIVYCKLESGDVLYKAWTFLRLCFTFFFFFSGFELWKFLFKVDTFLVMAEDTSGITHFLIPLASRTGDSGLLSLHFLWVSQSLHFGTFE